MWPLSGRKAVFAIGVTLSRQPLAERAVRAEPAGLNASGSHWHDARIDANYLVRSSRYS